MPDLNLRDYLWAALAVGLIITIFLFAAHERHIGEAARVAADVKLAAAQVIHNTEVESRAKTLNDAAMAKYAADTALPPIDSPHVLVRYLTRTVTVPAPGTDTGPAAAPSVPETGALDIGPGLDTIGRDADALVDALWARIDSDTEVCGVNK